MKKVIAVLFFVLVFGIGSAAWAGEKEELQLKQAYFKEHLALLQTQSQLMQVDFERSQAELKKVEEALAAMTPKEDKKP
jgi:hypothetical protein